MKKLLLVLISLLLVVGIAGCGGPTAKEEAKQFNDTYYVKGFRNGLYEESANMIEKFIEQYGDSTEVDKAFVASGQPEKIKNYLDTVKNVKIQNKEVEPLKAALVTYLSNFDDWLAAALAGDDSKAVTLYDNSVKLRFDYENTYSKIETGQGLPVVNTPSGQYLATASSNVFFAITDIDEKNIAGKGYFVKKPQGKFILVKIFIYNNQKDAITIDSNSFHLIDKEGRQFSTSTEGMSAIHLSEGHTKGFLTQLNPTMSIESTFVFDVPANAKIKDYQLEARGGMTGDKVKIPLVIRKTGY